MPGQVTVTVRMSPRTRIRLEGGALVIADTVRLELDDDYGAVGAVAVTGDLVDHLNAMREEAQRRVRVEAMYPLPDGVVDIGSVGEFLGTLGADWAPGEIMERYGK